MISKRPHTITLRTASRVEQDGELKTVPQLELTIKARFVEKHNYSIKKGKDEVVITGVVYVDQEKITDAEELEFNGVTYSIVFWKQDQYNNKIYVTS